MEDWIIDPIGEEMRRIKREADAMRAMMNPVPPIDRTFEDAVRMSNMAEEAMRAAALSPAEMLGITAPWEEEPARIDLVYPY